MAGIASAAFPETAAAAAASESGCATAACLWAKLRERGAAGTGRAHGAERPRRQYAHYGSTTYGAYGQRRPVVNYYQSAHVDGEEIGCWRIYKAGRKNH